MAINSGDLYDKLTQREKELRMPPVGKYNVVVRDAPRWANTDNGIPYVTMTFEVESAVNKGRAIPYSVFVGTDEGSDQEQEDRLARDVAKLTKLGSALGLAGRHFFDQYSKFTADPSVGDAIEEQNQNLVGRPCNLSVGRWVKEGTNEITGADEKKEYATIALSAYKTIRV